jgi:outer membrane protein with beta-barrel domain
MTAENPEPFTDSRIRGPRSGRRRGSAVAALAFAVLALGGSATARAQQFGLGGSVGWNLDVSRDAQFDEFHFGNYQGWFEYQMEENVLLRLTGGTIKTRQTNSGAIVETPTGSATVPELDEHINYGIVSVSYRFWEGFFSSGLFGGIGGYGIHPDEVPEAYADLGDVKETVFGFHLGAEGEFHINRNVGVDLRLTYHNISAHPHRQFVNADVGATWRF